MNNRVLLGLPKYLAQLFIENLCKQSSIQSYNESEPVSMPPPITLLVHSFHPAEASQKWKHQKSKSVPRRHTSCSSPLRCLV